MIQEAKDVVVAAEASLKSLIERGVKEHRYAEVAEIAGIAERLTRLIRTEPSNTPPPAENPPKIASTKRAARNSARARKRNSTSGYPRFERDGDRLVKVGWSKKAREEYEHRASRDAVIAFARHLANRIGAGKVFSVEDILPVPDPSGGEVPAYQVYLTLGWLRDTSAIEKKGRDGYILRDASLVDGSLDKLWDELPKHGVNRSKSK